MDELQKAGTEELNIHIKLDSTAFQSSDYVNLMQAVDENLFKSADLQTSKGYAYKRMGFCLNDAVDEARAWKLWVPAELRSDLFWRAHHVITAGHGGLHKSLAKLRQFYYWPGMAVDVQNFPSIWGPRVHTLGQRQLMTRCGIRHVRTGLYSPQANAAERVSRSLLQILRATVATDQRNWETQLSRIECALRNGLHESIGMEPYYAMFGTRMVTHGTAYPIVRKLGGYRQEIHR